MKAKISKKKAVKSDSRDLVDTGTAAMNCEGIGCRKSLGSLKKKKPMMPGTQQLFTSKQLPITGQYKNENSPIG